MKKGHFQIMEHGQEKRSSRTKKLTVAVLAVMLSAVMMLSGCGSKEQTTPDTIRWVNASYAILTELNGNDYAKFGGMNINEMNKKMQILSLDKSWGVTDRKSADETLEWVLKEGHRTGFVEDAKFLAQDIGMDDLEEQDYLSYILYVFEVDEEQAQFMADTYVMYKEYGEHAIDAWDYCRALNLLSFYYVAGYYTEEEALDKSLEIAKEFQPMYSSWDELIDSYLRGYEYWAQESSDERRAVYEELKTREDNPYAVDYNITLEKSW